MREILFRGKRCDNSEWVQGFLLKECNYSTCSWNLAIEYKTDRFGKFAYDVAEIATETVGQFTGLTDKNGKKIFEGDIVRCISMTDMANMIVIFEDGEFRMVLCEKYKDYISGCGFYAIRCFDKEIIGNIHDNPELLKNP